MTSAVYSNPTPSQWANAARHMELRDDPQIGWRTIHIDDVRYVVMTSAVSGRVHWARADALGCDCLWSQRAATPCSHRLALELAATLVELAESTPIIERLRALYPPCAGGCGNITEGNAFCDECSAARERAERLAAARRRAIEAWI